MWILEEVINDSTQSDCSGVRTGKNLRQRSVFCRYMHLSVSAISYIDEHIANDFVVGHSTRVFVLEVDKPI